MSKLYYERDLRLNPAPIYAVYVNEYSERFAYVQEQYGAESNVRWHAWHWKDDRYHGYGRTRGDAVAVLLANMPANERPVLT